MLNTGLYQGRTKAASDTLPLAARSLFASLKSEGKVLVVPECSAGKTALVQGRSRPGFMEPFWDKWDRDNWDNKRFQHALDFIHTSFIYNNINILLIIYY